MDRRSRFNNFPTGWTIMTEQLSILLFQPLSLLYSKQITVDC